MSPAPSRPSIPGDYAAKLEAARASRSMQGERRVVTILFCDVTGSTAMAEQLDPEEWAEIMDDAFDYLIAPVYRYEGTVARLMGDAVLAFFGAPIAHEDDSQRAVLAGLDIVAGIQPFREHVRQEYGLDFNIRVGINTGTVVVGEIGSDLAMEYTAMGDAVNLAARMEQTAQPGTVQVSGSTYKLISPLFEVEALGPVEVKGKSEPVPAYRVTGRKAAPGRLRGIAGLESPLVGRQSEMQAIKAALENLLLGRGQIIALIGEAGLGKSRLIEEIQAEWSRLTGESGFWLASQAISYDSQQPYGLFRQQLRQSCGVTERDSPEVARQKILGNFEAAPGLSEDEAARMRRAVEILLSVDAEEVEADVNGEALKRELYETALNMYRVSSQQAPLVLVYDDLHWADVASIELLLHLFQLVETLPVLFVCAFRPYRQSPGWRIKPFAETNYPHVYTEILLSPLSEEDSGALVTGLLQVSRLPDSLRHRILEKAEGNPFFVEEVVRTLIERGVIVRDADGLHWEAAVEVDEISIPDSLQALLVARIDRLEQDVRRTLQMAAIIGRRFYYRILDFIADTAGELGRQMSTLQRVELIREAARVPELEYMFRHELTRDATYDTILHKQRREYHRRVGEAIESLFPERLDEEAHRLAQHFKEARDYPKALNYYTRAGDAAARLFANAEAADHYGQALEIAQPHGSDEQIIYLYTRRGRAFELLGEYEAALSCYHDLERLAESKGDSAMQLAALIPQATIHATPTDKQDPERGRALAARSLELARHLGDFRAEARSLWALLLVETFHGNKHLDAVAYGEQALAIARQHGLKEELAFILNDIPQAYVSVGRMEDAIDTLQEAIGHWRELNNLPMLADSLGTLAQSLYLMGDLDQAIERAQEGLRASQRAGSAWGQSYTLMTIGPIYLERGEIDAAVQALTQSVGLAEQANFTGPMAYVLFLLAFIYLSFGDKQSANELLQVQDTEDSQTRLAMFEIYTTLLQALKDYYEGNAAAASQGIAQVQDQLLDEGNYVYFGGILASFSGEVALANGEAEQALDIAEKTVHNAHLTKTRLFLPDVLLLKSKALDRLNRSEEAYSVLLDALSEARAQESRRSLWPILAALSRLLERRGDLPGAEAARQEGRQVVEFIAGHIGKAELRESFLNLPQVQELVSG